MPGGLHRLAKILSISFKIASWDGRLTGRFPHSPLRADDVMIAFRAAILGEPVHGAVGGRVVREVEIADRS